MGPFVVREETGRNHNNLFLASLLQRGVRPGLGPVLQEKENSNFSAVSVACWKLKEIFSHAGLVTPLDSAPALRCHGIGDHESHPLHALVALR